MLVVCSNLGHDFLMFVTFVIRLVLQAYDLNLPGWAILL